MKTNITKWMPIILLAGIVILLSVVAPASIGSSIVPLIMGIVWFFLVIKALPSMVG